MANVLSVWELYRNADVVVQSVMFILLAGSCLSWMIIFQRALVLRQQRQANRTFETQFWSGSDLGQLFELTDKHSERSGLMTIFHAGFKEFARLKQRKKTTPDALMQGVERTMNVALATELEKLEHQLSLLATIGSVSPYVGLFGTVWGIMHAFIALGDVQQATLPMVAPGIAEALIATAMGLFVAIPAVIAYNRYAHESERQGGRLDTFKDEFASVLHRQVYAPTAAEQE